MDSPKVASSSKEEFQNVEAKAMTAFQTPPSRIERVRNPFEDRILERLHTHLFSPTVFNKINTPKTAEKFKWTIDELSHMKPAHIDEETMFAQFRTPEHDSALESYTQSRIDTFFNTQEVVPSPPCNGAPPPGPLIDECAESPTAPAQRIVETNDNTAQTELTLPPVLPPDLEAALKPYFSYTKDQQGGDVAHRHSSIYRQLFEFPKPAYSTSDESSPARSINSNMSPIQFSDTGSAVFNRNFGTPLHERKEFLQECDLSPICTDRRNEEHSSMSFTVPEPELSKEMLDSTKSFTEHRSANSTVNWDVEFKRMSPAKDNDMDVSNSNTPKSRKPMGQRKKLSDSFGQEEIDDNHFMASTPTKQMLL